MKNRFQRKGRTLKTTIDDLASSKRLEIAVHLFPIDKGFLEAMLVELGLEAQIVARNCTMRKFKQHEGLDWFNEMKPMLSRFDDFNTYNIHFTQLDEVSRRYYLKDPKLELGLEERRKVLNEIKKELNGKGES